MAFALQPGSAHPLGITTSAEGVNFSLFSESATEVALLLFDGASAVEPTQVIRLDPFQNKTFHFWHVFVRGCGPGTYYAFRVDGPWDPSQVHRFNANKVLIGPYAMGLAKRLWKRADAVGPEIVRKIIDELGIQRDRDVLFRYYILEEDKDKVCADLRLSKDQFSRIIFRARKRYKELHKKLAGKIGWEDH